MKKLQRVLFVILIMSTFGFSWPFSLFVGPNKEQFGTPSWIQKEFQLLKPTAGNIDNNVLRLSLIAYANAQKDGYTNKKMLTVIDYSKPSSEKRMWVFDIKNGRTLFNTWVAHGKNSGDNKTTSFSNTPGSLKSSYGVFVTADTYTGKNGYSLRLFGLERGINDLAYSRAIVIHGAAYTNPANIAAKGRLGRSWGCPAVSPILVKPLINTIKDKSLIFAYYPDNKWLTHSRFLIA